MRTATLTLLASHHWTTGTTRIVQRQSVWCLPFAVVLASGMHHEYRTLREAISSQYWNGATS